MSDDEAKRAASEACLRVSQDCEGWDWLKALGISEDELLDVVYGVDDNVDRAESTYTSDRRVPAEAARESQPASGERRLSRAGPLNKPAAVG